MKNTVNFENLKKLVCNKKKLVSILMVVFFVVPCIFAEDIYTKNLDMDFGMNAVMAVVVKFLTSKWIIGIVIALLAFEIVLFITAGRADNQAWKKFVPIILGTGLFLATPRITSYFINNDRISDTQTKALNLLKEGTYSN